jgi:hypothetical protein
LGRNRSPPAAAASFFFKEEGTAANLSIRIDRSCWRLAMSYIYKATAQLLLLWC